MESGYGSGGRPDPSKAEILSEKVGSGMVRPNKHSAAPGVFSNYEYQYSEYDRVKEQRAQDEREEKSKRIHQEEFKCTALPAIPKSTGAFNEFEYSLEPYEASEDIQKIEKQRQDAKILFGAMKAGGKVQSDESLKIRAHECIAALTKVFQKEWPKAFLRVFEDDQGLVVICFDKDKMGEGDITSYMNQFFRTHAHVAEYKLRRDTTRWGIMEEGVPNVYYVFLPPWVHLRVVHPELSKVPDQKPVPGLAEPSLVSQRIPFCPQTEGGDLIITHTQTYPRSFKH